MTFVLLYTVVLAMKGLAVTADRNQDGKLYTWLTFNIYLRNKIFKKNQSTRTTRTDHLNFLF